MFSRMSCGEVRWAFNTRKWQPTASEWSLALSCVQKEEQERIQKFMYRRDAKSSLAGQLMIRKVVSEALRVPPARVVLSRSESGKPFVENPRDVPIEFNVSHQGLYTVLAATPTGPIGVDIMQIDLDRFQNKQYKVNSFFHTMRRQFTPSEWSNIRTGELENQLFNFYRHWSLKESYVKATGTGIGFDLQRIDFQVGESLTLNGVKSTKVKVDGRSDQRWHFSEFLLDENHCVAVASVCPSADFMEPFKFLTTDELLKNAQSVTEMDQSAGLLFISKEEEPQLHFASS